MDPVTLELALTLVSKAPALIGYVMDTYAAYTDGKMTQEELASRWKHGTQEYADGVSAWEASKANG